MANPKNKHHGRFQELIGTARQMNIEVRMEKLLREVGYRVRSGRCRLNGREVILIDRDAPISEQLDFLAAELGHQKNDTRPIGPLSPVTSDD
jgi:hypothetical protein